MTAPFSMDTIEFLQTIGRLERRFDEVTSPTAMQSAYAAYERDGSPTPWDHRLYVLARDIFSCGSWTANLCAAAMSFDSQLGRECRDFLTGCGNTVRKYGISVWLYDLMNDSNLALFASEPSSRMPALIQNLSREQLAQRRAKRGRKRYGNRKQRERAMAEHSLQMHRLAAHTMLRWGADERRSLDIARMLLVYQPIGMCMLREDGDVLRMGAAPDMRYRRVVDHLQDRRAQADVEYELSGAQWLRDYVQAGRAAAPDVRIELCYCDGCAELCYCDRCVGDGRDGRDADAPRHVPRESGGKADDGCVCMGGTVCDVVADRCPLTDLDVDLSGAVNCDGRSRPEFHAAERRYRYDAARLVAAYLDLWDERTVDPGSLLLMLERDRDVPDEPLWRDVAYLRDLAFSLLGEQLAADLVGGFTERDAERFRAGVMRLQQCVDMVWVYGLALMPLVMYMDMEYGAAFAPIAEAVQQADDEKRYSMSPQDMHRLERDIVSLVDDGKESEPTVDLNGKMHLGESMAVVVLSRFPDERIARACALALFHGDEGAYGDALESVIPPPDGGPGDDGPDGGGDGDGPAGDDVLKRLDFAVDFADDLMLAQSTDW
ncbi:riboflavin deaminase [Bifidobacterium leontopitheci]|uniref:Riboflavin deaminase n=1 Tax=Bifidobacterium leontopitheci TaxID=2650774 RepID=A0A6I1GJ66_9BIFI|nr:riboflavin deaminase [Bifidobacterium leontopitheci]KAB7789666.1 riboflavin deaminase [Bifidobacterium leontopitheci]